jgi:hypothetical protein
MDKLQEVQALEAKNSKLNLIITDLEHSSGWNALLDLVREDLKVLDDTWHWIPENDAARRMEARATKMAYVHLTNIIDICKDDLKRSLQLIEEIKSTELDS